MVKSRVNHKESEDREKRESQETITEGKPARKNSKVDAQDELNSIFEAYSPATDPINSEFIDVKLKYTSPSEPTPPRLNLVQRRLTDILIVGKQSKTVVSKA